MSGGDVEDLQLVKYCAIWKKYKIVFMLFLVNECLWNYKPPIVVNTLWNTMLHVTFWTVLDDTTVV